VIAAGVHLCRLRADEGDQEAYQMNDLLAGISRAVEATEQGTASSSDALG
jgi:hypothetical protein